MRRLIAQRARAAVEAAVADGVLSVDVVPEVEVERPRDPTHGDWSTNVAMKMAASAGLPPRELAGIIAERLGREAGGDVAFDSVEIAGPGFINVRLATEVFRAEVTRIRREGPSYGRSDLGLDDTGTPRRVQVEFVSANPVGPMHVGHGRWAALGDSMARLLEHVGWEVEREFYVNDAGVQMDIFAKSVAARYLELCGHEVVFEQDWYQGAYIADIAQEILDDEGAGWADAVPAERETHFREKAYEQVLEHLRRVLHSMGVDFDVWFSERTLHSSGGTAGQSGIERAIARLRESGHVYEQDGAVWFGSTALPQFADDKDRVLRKGDGSYTYFAADVAYHWDKFENRPTGAGSTGFDRVIDLWGADHHGYVARMKAAAAALGHDGKLELVIGQMVNLFRNGEAVRMSKRTGEMVTFEELLDEVGADAARYWFLRRSTDQPVDFDIGLAKKQSAENPVYYVQYAHARICSILRKAAGADTADERVDVAAVAESVPVSAAEAWPLGGGADGAATEGEADAEAALMRKLAEFPDVIELSAEQLAPFKLARYSEDLAAVFHQFYTVCQVVVSDTAQREARLALVDATRIVLATALGLLGVSAPQRM